MSEENTNVEVTETSPIALYAKQCMDQFQGLSTQWNAKEKEEFKKAIEEIVMAFAGEGEDAAKKKFETQYLPKFEVLAKAKDAMAQFGGLKREAGYGLHNLADQVETMNCATAVVTTQLFQLPLINKIPGVTALSAALNGLAEIDKTLLAVTGGEAKGQTFGSVAKLIRGVATQAESMGIPVNTLELQGKIAELSKSEPAQQALASMKEIQAAIANSDILVNLREYAEHSSVGKDYLQPLATMAKNFMPDKGKSSAALN